MSSVGSIIVGPMRPPSFHVHDKGTGTRLGRTDGTWESSQRSRHNSLLETYALSSNSSVIICSGYANVDVDRRLPLWLKNVVVISIVCSLFFECFFPRKLFFGRLKNKITRKSCYWLGWRGRQVEWQDGICRSSPESGLEVPVSCSVAGVRLVRVLLATRETHQVYCTEPSIFWQTCDAVRHKLDCHTPAGVNILPNQRKEVLSRSFAYTAGLLGSESPASQDPSLGYGPMDP